MTTRNRSILAVRLDNERTAFAFIRRYALRNNVKFGKVYNGVIQGRADELYEAVAEHARIKFPSLEIRRAWAHSPTMNPASQAFVWKIVK